MRQGLDNKTHAQFKQIHPFSDGNGRAGRLIMLAKALQLGITPPNVEQKRKVVYYKYLQRAQRVPTTSPERR